MISRRQFLTRLSSGLLVATAPAIVVELQRWHTGFYPLARDPYIIDIDGVLLKVWNSFRIEPDRLIVHPTWTADEIYARMAEHNAALAKIEMPPLMIEPLNFYDLDRGSRDVADWGNA